MLITQLVAAEGTALRFESALAFGSGRAGSGGYPNLFFKQGDSTAATLSVTLRSRRKAVNLAVLALSWLFMYVRNC